MPLNPVWNPTINHVTDGEPVAGAVDSRPTKELESRTEYLKGRLDAIDGGNAVLDRDQPLLPGMLLGTPVYWDSGTNQYKPARSGRTLDPLTGEPDVIPESYVLGLLWSKDTDYRGTILVGGIAELDMTAQAGGNSAGDRYLSDLSGVLSLTPSGPYVALVLGNGRVSVNPSYRNFAEAHRHLSADLITEAAGTPGISDDRVVINSANPALPGWLPANHPIFNGLAPDKAQFGYNLSQDPTLAAAWPPDPAYGAQVIWDRGEGGTFVPVGLDALVYVDNFGIWWMSDCQGYEPWLDPLLSGPTSSSSGANNCPPYGPSRMTLLFTQAAGSSAPGAVVSLQPADSSVEILSCETGEIATQGNLKIRFNPAAATVEEGNLDPNAFKSIEQGDDGPKYTRGPVAVGLRAADGSVTVSGSETFSSGGNTYAHGLINITTNLSGATGVLIPSLVRLEDVRQRFYEDIPLIGFPANQVSSLRLQFTVPPNLPSATNFRLNLTLMGAVSGTIPNLTFTYRILPKVTVPTSIPTVDTPFVFATTQVITSNQYYDIGSNPLSVNPGDKLLFSITRSGTLGYSGEVGLIQAYGVLGS